MTADGALAGHYEQAGPGAGWRQPLRVAARERLLDAAREQLTSRPWCELTMAEVARCAGTNRARLYEIFGSRAGLGRALAARELAAIVTQVRAPIAAHPADPARALLGAFDAFLTASEESPLIGGLLRGEARELLALPSGGQTSPRKLATRRLARIICDAWPLTAARDAALLSDALVRLAVSHAMTPGRRPLPGSSPAEPFAPYIQRTIIAADGRATRALSGERASVAPHAV